VVRGAAVVVTTAGVLMRGVAAGAVIATVLTGTRGAAVVTTAAGTVRGTVDATPGLNPPPLFSSNRLTSGTVVVVEVVVVVVDGVPTARWPFPPHA
jgi:hypothetical protein